MQEQMSSDNLLIHGFRDPARLLSLTKRSPYLENLEVFSVDHHSKPFVHTLLYEVPYRLTRAESQAAMMVGVP